MKIGIDARLIDETGVGRYIRNLIRQLIVLDDQNEYVVFLYRTGFNNFIVPNARWKKVRANVRWHTVFEQCVMPFLFAIERLDVVHIPYFNIPIFYNGAMIVTIHDLTIKHFDTGKASTGPWLMYKVKRFLYGVIVSIGIKKVRHIIVPSNATKNEIQEHYGIAGDKITVTYEGVNLENKKTGPLFSFPYFLYVGNAYPHKNLAVVIDALSHFKSKAKIVFVGKEDFFYKRLHAQIITRGLSSRVVFFGAADDATLVCLYTYAQALLFPSLMEGFGLPPLEALSFGCPVIASNIPVHKEILQDMVTYFPSSDSKHLATLLFAWKKSDHQISPQKMTSFLKKYDWHDMAKKTLKLYESCTRI